MLKAVKGCVNFSMSKLLNVSKAVESRGDVQESSGYRLCDRKGDLLNSSSEYVNQVGNASEASHPFRSGVHLKTLSRFLSSPAPVFESIACVQQYDLSSGKTRKIGSFRNPDDFYDTRICPAKEVLFLCGPPDPSWIRCLGQLYDVPAEFWTCHFDFFAASEREGCVSAGAALVIPGFLHFDVPSVAVVGDERRHLSEKKLHHARMQAAEHVQGQLTEIRRCKSQGPVLRALNLHRGDLISVEQRVSMTLVSSVEQSAGHAGRKDSDRWTLLVCSDSNDISEFLGKLLGKIERFSGQKPPSFRPLSLNINTEHVDSIQNSDPEIRANFEPDLTHLGTDYEHTMHNELDTTQAYHSTFGVCQVMLCSLAQLFFTVGHIIDEQLEKFAQPPEEVFEYNTSLTFQTHKVLLRRHGRQLRELKTFLETPEGSGWDIGRQRNQMHHIWKGLIRQCNKLHDDLNEMLHKCEQGEIMDNKRRSILDFGQAQNQARSMFWLTRVTTSITIFWLPLSYIASFFGMNIQELNNTGPSLRIWAEVTVVLLALCLAMHQRFISPKPNLPKPEAK